MKRAATAVRKVAIVCHRWMGVAFCLLFLWWFVTGIFMMYWTYPEVSDADRLRHAPALDAARIKLTPSDAATAAGLTPTALRLASFDGRPAYFLRAGGGSAIVYADTGELQDVFPPQLNSRTAAAWTGQAAASATVETVTEPDQWTLGIRRQLPLQKYTFADGQQVYVSEETGQVAQHTTRASRIYAHLGAIPHWLYYTPLRVNGELWTRVVVWSSGIATLAALLGLIVGIWMWSPTQRYRHAGQPTSIPYTGQKRLHTILGLFFGILAMTWAFSGMLSMEPFTFARSPASAAARDIQQALGGRLQLERFAGQPPANILSGLGGVKELEYTSFAGTPVIHAKLSPADLRVIPASDARKDLPGIIRAAGGNAIEEMRTLEQYDRYYLDRTFERPLPVIYLRLKDSTRLYIDPKTARVVGRYSESTGAWVNRWLYHGLHSLDFPWLYNYRPAWDVVVLSLMLGCVWLCWTSMVLSWRVLKRKLGSRRAPSEDLAV